MLQTYICPSCHRKLVFKDKVGKTRGLGKIKVNRRKSDVLYPEVSLKEELYDAVCVNCGTHMFHADNEIADIIIALNSAGLRTKRSCSGHTKKNINLMVNDATAVYPYIVFDPSSNELLRQIPEQFYSKCAEIYNLLEFRKCVEKYDLAESQKYNLAKEDICQIKSNVDAEKIPCFCLHVGFKFRFTTVYDRHGNVHVTPVRGKEYIPECLIQMRKFSEDLIEEVNKIYLEKRGAQ